MTILSLDELLIDLTEITDEEYEVRRRPLAEEYDVRVSFLDKKRAERRAAAASAVTTEKETANPDELLTAGQEILDAPDVLQLFRQAIQALGYAGNAAAAEITHLSICSRFLDRPLNIVLEGPSAAGKTFTVETIAKLHPPGALRNLTGASERAFVYTDYDFRHAVVYIGESSALHEDGISASILRSLAWGDGIRYSTVEKGPDGKHRERLIVKPGPTGLITTTTKSLDPELATRLLAVPIPDDTELTREIVRAQAEAAAGKKRPGVETGPWIAAAQWLATAGERQVVIPFAPDLATVVPVDDVRLRRDFAQVLTLIQTLALIHQRTRERDELGRIVASTNDYDSARKLLKDVLAATVDSVPEIVRQTVAVVENLLPEHPEGVPVKALAEDLGMSRQSALRRAKLALQGGYLVNQEERPRYPFRLAIGETLPPVRVVLPRLPQDSGCQVVTPTRGDNLTTTPPGSSKGAR